MECRLGGMKFWCPQQYFCVRPRCLVCINPSCVTLEDKEITKLLLTAKNESEQYQLEFKDAE